MTQPFHLHPQLAADTVPIGDLPLCRCLLLNDANYPWLILVPRRADLTEWMDLTPDEHHQLSDELSLCGAVLKELTGAEKINIAALGNRVRQLHIHVIARFETDAAWPGPIWDKVPRVLYSSEAATALAGRLSAALGLSPLKGA